ncbi:MAG: YCF48-related protein, partial [Calditrichota bacterium]
NVYLTSVFFVDQYTGWACGNSAKILNTTDGGNTWLPQSSSLIVELNSVFFINDSTGWIAGHNGKIIKTTDGGENWTTQTSGVGDKLTAIWFTDNAHGWAAGWDGAITKTIDGGDNWEAQPRATNASLTSLIFIDSDTGWMTGTYGTILKYTGSSGSGITYKSNLIKEFRLEQNYPNPFNPSTKIEFNLPVASEVSLKIFNILGEEVATIVSEKLHAGSYIYKWSNTKSMASGIYFYRLSGKPINGQSAGFVDTRKMVLLK